VKIEREKAGGIARTSLASVVGCREKNWRNERRWRCRLHCTGAVIAGFRRLPFRQRCLRPHRMRSDVWRKLVELRTDGGTGRRGVGKVQPQAISGAGTTRTSHCIVPGRRLRREALYKLSQIALRASTRYLALQLSQLFAWAVHVRPPAVSLFSRASDPITFWTALQSVDCFVPLLRSAFLPRRPAPAHCHYRKFFQARHINTQITSSWEICNTTCRKNLPFYFCNNLVKPRSVFITFGTLEWISRSIFHIPYKTRNSSWDEIANVNFLYDDVVHAVQNTIDSWINSATDRRGYLLKHRFTKFSEITQCNGHSAVQGHLRSLILVPIVSSYTTSYSD